MLSRPRKSHTGGRSRNDPGFNLSAFLDHVWVTQEEVKAHSLSHRRNVFPWSQGEVWVLWVCWCLPLGQTQPRREIPVWADLRSSAWRLYFVILRKYAPTPLSHRLSRTHKLGLFWPWSRQNFVWELKKKILPKSALILPPTVFLHANFSGWVGTCLKILKALRIPASFLWSF